MEPLPLAYGQLSLREFLLLYPPSWLSFLHKFINKSVDSFLVDVIDLDVAVAEPDEQACSEGVPGNRGHRVILGGLQLL